MSEIKIYFSNPKLGFVKRKAEFVQVFESVLENGNYILGNEVTAFEKEFAAYIGVNHCVGVANGTDAIAVSLKALGVNAGDEVITVSHSAVATVAAIEMIGAIPVFADIEPSTRCIDPSKIEKLISSRTKAIIPVHIYGHPARMKEILQIVQKYSIKVLEDCAQAHGAKIGNQKVGSFGDAAAFSFYPTKNLGAVGDGGAVVTNSSEVYQKALALRQYGWYKRYISDIPGINSRLDELQAAVLRLKLRELDKDNLRRNEIAERYCAGFKNLNIKTPQTLENNFHVYHLYVIEYEQRDELAKFLDSKGIGTALHYPSAIHQQPAYVGRIRGCNDLFVTEKLYKNILTLPMYPELNDDQVDLIISSIKEFFND